MSSTAMGYSRCWSTYYGSALGASLTCGWMLVTQRQGQRQGLGREGALGLKAQEVIRRPPRSRYVWVKEGEEIDWERLRKLLPEPFRLQGSTETLGGRADVFLDRVEQENESKDY